MKRFIIALLCLAMLLSLCGCKAKPVAEKYCDSLAEAEKLIGFKIDTPESLSDSKTKTFRAGGRTLEICYFDGKVLKGRISKADNLENINGLDYGYTYKTETAMGGTDYTLRSAEANGTIHLAEWTKGKYSYMVLLSDCKTVDEMIAFCKTIN